MAKATRWDSTRLIPRAGSSLHFGLSAPPPAPQASVPGVASETQTCFNGVNVGERTVLSAIPLNIYYFERCGLSVETRVSAYRRSSFSNRG